MKNSQLHIYEGDLLCRHRKSNKICVSTTTTKKNNKIKTFYRFHISSRAHMDWMFTLDLRWEHPVLYLQPAGTQMKGHTQVKKKKKYTSIGIKDEKTEICHSICFLLTGPAMRVRTQFIWFPLYTALHHVFLHIHTFRVCRTWDQNI